MRFKPYTGLTIITAICLAILLSLGTWQYQRMGWKAQLLADVQTASQSAPFENAAQVSQALERGEPVDYRRIVMTGTYSPAGAENWSGEFHVFKVENKTTGWRIFRPVQSARRGGGDIVFVAGEWIPDTLKDAQRILPTGEHVFAGYVRTYEKPSRFVAKSTPEQNRWFSFNADPQGYDWGQAISGGAAQTAFYIDSVYYGTSAFTGDLPVRVPEIPNNHFDYMLTWYSFALILLVIYFILHIRGNRLTFGRKS